MVLTRSNIPTIVAAVRDASRSKSEMSTFAHLPRSTSMPAGTAPMLPGAPPTAPSLSTLSDATRNAYPTAADEMQLQEFGK